MLLVVLGIRIAEVQATKIWGTAGLRAWRLANVSQVDTCFCVHDLVNFTVLCVRAFDRCVHANTSSDYNAYQSRVSRVRHHSEIWEN